MARSELNRRLAGFLKARLPEPRRRGGPENLSVPMRWLLGLTRRIADTTLRDVLVRLCPYSDVPGSLANGFRSRTDRGEGHAGAGPVRTGSAPRAPRPAQPPPLDDLCEPATLWLEEEPIGSWHQEPKLFLRDCDNPQVVSLSPVTPNEVFMSVTALTPGRTLNFSGRPRIDGASDNRRSDGNMVTFTNRGAPATLKVTVTRGIEVPKDGDQFEAHVSIKDSGGAIRDLGHHVFEAYGDVGGAGGSLMTTGEGFPNINMSIFEGEINGVDASLGGNERFSGYLTRP